MKLLLVEDDEICLQVFTLTFQHQGLEVLPAENGAVGWQVFQQHQPDIVFSDWMMPEVDGIELTRRIRAWEQDKECYTYIILGSAHDRGIQDYVEAVQAGVDNFLHKPWQNHELMMTIAIARRTVQYLREIGKLRKFLPICKHCKKVRTDNDFWERIEKFVKAEVGSDFSHGVCPDCAKKICEEYGLPQDFLKKYQK